jgi:Polyketide cyclase / dehydrase and lipid transport
MPKVKMETKLNIPADTLWKTIGGFNALPEWHPAVAKSEASGESKGSTRTLSLAGGGSLVERLEESSAANKLYRYSILSGPLPVADYVAEIHVKDNGDGTSTVEWSSDFRPKDATESDAVKAIQGVYQAGFDNLKKMFGG